jgi:hypothetical protein
MGLGNISAKTLSYLSAVIWNLSVLSSSVQYSVATLYRSGKENGGFKKQ